MISYSVSPRAKRAINLPLRLFPVSDVLGALVNSPNSAIRNSEPPDKLTDRISELWNPHLFGIYSLYFVVE